MPRPSGWPASHVPAALRPAPPPEPPRDREETFACGYLDGTADDGTPSFGMFAGPFPTLGEALEVVPDETDRAAYVLHFRTDGTNRPVYLWRGVAWARTKEAPR